MASFKIITNTTADLPMDYIVENQVGLIYFNYIMDGVSYGKDHELDWKEFYRLMREEGKMPTTSQVNPQQYKEYFTEFLKENKNLLYISFSSGLSSTKAISSGYIFAFLSKKSVTGIFLHFLSCQLDIFLH